MIHPLVEKIVKKTSVKMFLSAYQFVGSVCNKKDFEQECYLKLIRQNLMEVREEYLLTIFCRRACIDFVRKIRRKRKHGPFFDSLEELMETSERNRMELVCYQPTDEIINRVAFEQLLNKTELLSTKEKEVIEKQLRGITLKEIGRLDGVTESAAGFRKRKALDKIRDKINQYKYK